MMHHEITFFFLHQTRPSSANVAISCGLTSRIFQNLPEPGQKEHNNCSRVVTTNKTGDHSHHSTSFITHIIMMGSGLVRQRPVRYQIVLFSAFRRAPNRAFFCVSSCSKSCFFLRFVVLQIVLFSAFRRAPNRAFFCVSSCSKSCFFLRFVVLQIVLFCLRFVVLQIVLFCLRFVVLQIVLFSLRFVVLQIVLFSAFRRAPNRAFFCVSSCSKSCIFLRFVVLQIVLFSAFRRAPNRAFFCVSSCSKSCSKSCFFLRLLVGQILFFTHSLFHIAASVPPCLMYYSVCLLAKTLGLALQFFPKATVLQMVLQIVLFYSGLFKTIKGKAQFIAPFFAPEKLQFLWIPS